MTNISLAKLVEQKSSSTPDDLIEVGRVLNAYGLNGLIKVQPFSPTADTLLKSKRWWLVSLANPKFVFYQVKTAKPHSGSIVVTFENPLNRDQAEALKGQRIWVSRADFPKTDQDEYYWVDLIGCVVFTEVSTEHSTEHSTGNSAEVLTIASAEALTDFPVDTDVKGKPDNSGLKPIGMRMGVVEEVLDHAAHALLSVRQQILNEQGQWVDVLDNKGRAVTTLIPFVAAHVTDVDIKARTIHTNWPLDF
jgi:16S rRNA processing protein RimM